MNRKSSVSLCMNMIRLSILGSLILIFSSVVFGYSVVLYPYGSITFPLFPGAVVEDFEDTTLIPGLVASVTGGGPPPGSDTNCVWDGTHCSSDQFIDGDFSFTIPNIRGFGIGIADNDSWGCESVTVNNSFSFSPSDYPNYDSSGTSQTYYLSIVADPDDPNFTSVSFSGCTIFFDHLELDRGGEDLLCNDQPVTILGTEANDKLIGTDGPDVIHGLGGFDIIWGMGGDDVICGGDGADNLSGRDGNDIILGGNGHDAIWGGYGDDILRGDDGNDTISGGPGNDELHGNHGHDALYGRSGVDELYGGEGTENNDSCYDDPGTFIMGCEQFNGEYIPSAPVPKTGCTRSYAPGDDGDLQKGVQWPDPRFTDNGNGTVTDHLTGLIWLRDADCFRGEGPFTWAQAVDMANNLEAGQCGLTDGSRQGHWRLPNVKEILSLIDYGGEEGDGWQFPRNHPFVNTNWVGKYWTSTLRRCCREHGGDDWVWYVDFGGRLDHAPSLLEEIHGWWPVRGGN